MSDPAVQIVPPQEPPKLYAKLAKVMAAMHRLEKRGFNQHQRYKFATSEDVSDLVRKELAEQGVMFLPTMQEIVGREEFPTKNGKTTRTTVHFKMRFVDGETGESTESDWFAEANDHQDKGLNKAATAAVKYFLLKTFLVSTGDEVDPDAEGANGNGGPKQQGQGKTTQRVAEKVKSNNLQGAAKVAMNKIRAANSADELKELRDWIVTNVHDIDEQKKLKGPYEFKMKELEQAQ